VNKKHRVILAIQWIVAIIVLAYIARFVDWRRAATVLSHADIRWLAVAFMLSLTSPLVLALRWAGLLDAIGIIYRVLTAYRTYLIGYFYSLAMPGVIGCDAVRVMLCGRETGAGLALISATALAERGLGVVALLLILSLGGAVSPIAGRGVVPGFVPLLALTGVGGVVMVPWLLRRFTFMQPSSILDRMGFIGRAIRRIGLALAPIKNIRVTQLLVALVLSLAAQFIDIPVVYGLSRSIGLHLNITMLLVAMPIVYLVTFLPISPGGLGLREGVMVVILAQFGVPTADAALLALVIFLNRVAIGGVGGVQFLFRDAKPTLGARSG